MKDRVEIGHLTKYDAFKVNRDRVMDLEIWLKNLYQFCVNCKIPSCTFYLKAEMKTAMFAHAF